MPSAMPEWCFYWLVVPMVLAGCSQQTLSERQTEALRAPQGAVAVRQLQTRRFDTGDDQRVLAAASGVLQDLGFGIDEVAAGAGLLVASKDREAVEAQQVAGQVLMVLLAAAAGGRHDPVWERDQRIRVSIVVAPAYNRMATTARVTFQRVVRDTRGQISRVETIDDAAIYREFFDKLGQSLFLDAHQI